MKFKNDELKEWSLDKVKDTIINKEVIKEIRENPEEWLYIKGHSSIDILTLSEKKAIKCIHVNRDKDTYKEFYIHTSFISGFEITGVATYPICSHFLTLTLTLQKDLGKIYTIVNGNGPFFLKNFQKWVEQSYNDYPQLDPDYSSNKEK